MVVEGKLIVEKVFKVQHDGKGVRKRMGNVPHYLGVVDRILDGQEHVRRTEQELFVIVVFNQDFNQNLKAQL